MIRTSRRRRRNGSPRSRGQALVEFAFVAPLFFLLLFAIVDFGRYVYYVQILNNAAREGARYAIVHGSRSFNPTGPPSADPTGTAVAAVVRNYAIGVIGSGPSFAIVSTWNKATGALDGTGTNDREQRVKVAVTYEFHSLIPIVPIPPITITGESTLVINN
jgi:Flp pilus assembly protein TadG